MSSYAGTSTYILKVKQVIVCTLFIKQKNQVKIVYMCVCQSKTGGWCQDRIVKKQAKTLLWEVNKKTTILKLLRLRSERRKGE